MRYCVTRGEGPVDLFPDPELATRYVIVVKELHHWRDDFYSHGVRLAVSRTRRNPINALNPNIKGGQLPEQRAGCDRGAKSRRGRLHHAERRGTGHGNHRTAMYSS